MNLDTLDCQVLEGATVEQRVGAGASFLDVEQPGWEHLIRPDTLNIASWNDCVVCQITGLDFGSGLKVLGLRYGTPLGFFPKVDPHDDGVAERDTADLDVAWRELLKHRADTGMWSDAE